MTPLDEKGGAFRRLWRRAPLWRLCVLGAIGLTGLCYVFPAPYLRRHLPRSLAHYLPAGPTKTTKAPSEGNHYLFSDPDRLVHGSVPFAGRFLPLPPGEWIPLLTAQDGPNGELTFLSMMRIHNGLLTGILTAESSALPVANIASPEFSQPCHDDRMLEKLDLSPPGDRKEACAFITRATLQPLDHATDSGLIKATLARITELGYPIPAQMAASGWRMQHLLTLKANIASVDYLSLDPAHPNSVPSNGELTRWAQTLDKAFQNAR